MSGQRAAESISMSRYCTFAVFQTALPGAVWTPTACPVVVHLLWAIFCVS